MPRTFKKKTTVQAVQWTGKNNEEVEAFAGEHVRFSVHSFAFRVRTREGESEWLDPGYWVVTDGQSFWPVADDFMQENYEEVTEESEPAPAPTA